MEHLQQPQYQSSNYENAINNWFGNTDSQLRKEYDNSLAIRHLEQQIASLKQNQLSEASNFINPNLSQIQPLHPLTALPDQASYAGLGNNISSIDSPLVAPSLGIPTIQNTTPLDLNSLNPQQQASLNHLNLASLNHHSIDQNLHLQSNQQLQLPQQHAYNYPTIDNTQQQLALQHTAHLQPQQQLQLTHPNILPQQQIPIQQAQCAPVQPSCGVRYVKTVDHVPVNEQRVVNVPVMRNHQKVENVPVARTYQQVQHVQVTKNVPVLRNYQKVENVPVVRNYQTVENVPVVKTYQRLQPVERIQAVQTAVDPAPACHQPLVYPAVAQQLPCAAPALAPQIASPLHHQLAAPGLAHQFDTSGLGQQLAAPAHLLADNHQQLGNHQHGLQTISNISI